MASMKDGPRRADGSCLNGKVKQGPRKGKCRMAKRPKPK
jgi:hypothetical protein